MSDVEYMALALELAERAAGRVSPDPMVGAVIVSDGEIVGRGYYAGYGAPHAEAIAIREAADRCAGATIYTNLEPCCHFGKNPPCVNAIIESGIRKVVSSIHDPNPKVDCKGFAALRAAGIEVEVGTMENEATELNEPFLKYITTRLPFVIASIAQTADGRIAQKNGHSQWITCEESRKDVHLLRSRYDAVMVGANTVRIDNPQLTVRHVEGRNPTRIVVAGSRPIDENTNVFTNGSRERTVLVCSPDQVHLYSNLNGVNLWQVETGGDGRVSPAKLLTRAGEERISSILLEGGSALMSSFFRHKLVDKVLVYTAPILLGSGLSALNNLGTDSLERAVRIRNARYRQIGQDILVSGYPVWR
jgi:diaminohydroxyphosphoribosylaminopyrimidine deaminase/5-amino-6-(5-phosphoribosylamino)uracil reductase